MISVTRAHLKLKVPLGLKEALFGGKSLSVHGAPASITACTSAEGLLLLCSLFFILRSLLPLSSFFSSLKNVGSSTSPSGSSTPLKIVSLR